MVLVSVSGGVLKGEVVDNEYGGSYCSFKGIPYAEPPVGELRFKPPQPVKPWNGVRNATTFGPMCYQLDPFDQQTPKGSEDCLYLNVYTPTVTPNKPLPVMFWIHGGGFQIGNGNDATYGPHFLLRHGVILVTINYRLEALGFLCLHTKDIPGNMGMKDQVAALRWVKNNISKFGGNPDNITIFGESSGAASVSFHLVSPMTKGLFRRAIAQSGSALNYWAMPFKPRERALALARQLGHYYENDKDLYEFLKSQPVNSLVQLKLPIIQAEATCKHFNFSYFGVVSEKKFDGVERYFHGDIFEALKNNIHDGIEIITGYNEYEGLFTFILEKDIKKVVNELNTFKDAYCPVPIILECSVNNQLEVSEMFRDYYDINEKVTKENIMNIVRYLSASVFSYNVLLAAKIYSKNINNKVYMYKFTCKSENNIFSYLVTKHSEYFSNGITSHADDLGYLFHNKMAHRCLDRKSGRFKMIDSFTKLWTNFAKYGNPTPNNELGVTWVPYTIEDQNYLNIGNKITARTDLDKCEMDYWEDIFRDYLPLYVCK